MTTELELLKTDFEQCFEQMRHYDSVFSNTVKFMLTGYAVVITATGGLLGLGLSLVTRWVGIAGLLFFTGLAGTLLLLVLLHNRKYYVRVARYVNEVRQSYIKQKVLGIQNLADIYTNPKLPRAMNPLSSQLIIMYFAAICNSVFYAFGTAAICIKTELEALDVNLLWPSIIFVASLILQISSVALYLKSADKDHSIRSVVKEEKDK